MSEFTILRDHPRWGLTTRCFDTLGTEVSNSNEVFRRWKANRVLTDSDTQEIESRRNQAIKALKTYKNVTGEAFELWQELAKKYETVETECQAGTRKHEGILESQCILFETGKLSRSRSRAALLLDEIGRKRFTAFRECDFVMVNAPTAEAARDICDKKQEAFSENKKLLNKIGLFNRFMSDVRSRAFKDYDTIIGGIITALQALLGIIQALIDLITAIVIEGVKIATKIAGFFIRNPSVLLIAGGAIGLGVLAFILRPYMTLLGIGRHRLN